MQSKKLSSSLILVLAIFSVALLMTGTRAVAEEKVLHSFNNAKGGTEPLGGLISDAAGNLYGTTASGGSGTNCVDRIGCGTVFELLPTGSGGWTEKILHNFNNNGKDGYGPSSGLVRDAAGNLYGTTVYGGTELCAGINGSGTGCGTAFELTPTGSGGWTERILHNFNNNGKDGYGPVVSLILDAAGNLYGTTFLGGASNLGTAFELTPTAGGGWSERILHTFDSSGKHGYGPHSSLIFDGGGNLYGTTNDGGDYGLGTAFELKPATGGGWANSDLYSFSYNDEGVGGYPNGGLIFDGSGNLYGTTVVGQSGFYGTAFELTPTAGGGWTENVLDTFDGTGPTSLIFDTAGNLYGTLWRGGTFGFGAIFELTASAGGGWTETVLHNFSNGGDGGSPNPSLILDAAGNLYDTTASGGRQAGGMVFEITP